MMKRSAFFISILWAALIISSVHGQEGALPDSRIDQAFGAFQRGYYLTALEIALEKAEQNDSAAQALLGVLYSEGLGIPKDAQKAAEWYEISAANGNREAIFELGLIYAEGRGVQTSLQRAADLFEKAANMGHVAAHYNMALVYLNGNGRTRDVNMALLHFEAAANKGYPEAFFSLGLLYKEGADVPIDIKKAANLIGTAAQFGLVAAQVEYGIMVFRGEGTDPNPQVAAAWLQAAADQHSPVAINRLARLYARGLGVEADDFTAAKLHLIARASGVSDLWLDSFVQTLDDDTQRKARVAAEEWFTLFAFSNAL